MTAPKSSRGRAAARPSTGRRRPAGTAAPRVTIRAARPVDVGVVEAFLQPFVDARQLLPRTAVELAHLLRHAVIARTGGQIVGFAAVEVYSRKLAEIQCLAVDPAWQGRGIGSRLVARCVEIAGQLNVLELMAISASEHFLKKCGFDYSLPGQKRALFFQPR